jgi:hypothetical protein
VKRQEKKEMEKIYGPRRDVERSVNKRKKK